MVQSLHVESLRKASGMSKKSRSWRTCPRCGYAGSVGRMRSALDELADATVVAVGRRRLEASRPTQLIRGLVLDATGVSLDGTSNWREELLAARLDPWLVGRAYAELQRLVVSDDGMAGDPGGGGRRANGDADEHIKVIGDPARWAPATTYPSLALAVIDSLWSIGSAVPESET
jgi:hypothetical protein